MFDHYHINVDKKTVKKLFKKLNLIIMANERIEAALATITGKTTEIGTSVEGVAADVSYLKTNLPTTGGMSQEEVDALATKLEDAAGKLSTAADSLKSLDDSTDSSGGSTTPPEGETPAGEQPA